MFFTSLLKLRENFAFSSKTVIDKKYRGARLSSILMFKGFTFLLKSHILDDKIKVDSDVRAVQIKAQKLTERAGGVPYGFIPFYNNFGDKRNISEEDVCPCPIQEEESAFLYFVLLPKLISHRLKKIYLPERKGITSLYDYIKTTTRTMRLVMRKDESHKISSKNNSNYMKYNDFSITKDLYGSKVKLKGLIDSPIIDFLIDHFKDYRMLIWHIPTTLKGVQLMNYAIDNGFIVCGYDVAGFKPRHSDDLIDCVIFVKYYNDISKKCLGEVYCTESNKPLYQYVLNQLS
ncbi:MAG: hypothetical protein P8Y97_18190 [Candidatus Lokiarchaeota archaeon]